MHVETSFDEDVKRLVACFCNKHDLRSEWEEHFYYALKPSIIRMDKQDVIRWLNTNFTVMLPIGPIRWFHYRICKQRFSELEKQMMTLESAIIEYNLERNGYA